MDHKQWDAFLDAYKETKEELEKLKRELEEKNEQSLSDSESKLAKRTGKQAELRQSRRGKPTPLSDD